MGESKFEVLKLVPDSIKPKTLLVKIPASVTDVTDLMRHHGLTLPVIFKPDMGERGWMVRRIKSESEIAQYLAEIKLDFIIQELVDLPLEYGVFYVRYPSESSGFVNSITGKEFLFVIGDGVSTLQELILANDRAKLQWGTLQEAFKTNLQEVLPAGQRLELVSVGNHCLGTKFLNCNHLITSQLTEAFDQISKQIPGFYFGRYDLRCASEADLERGHVKVMELNGCGAEPAHIYHPGSSLWKALQVMITHWRNLYRISRENHARGVPYLSFQKGKKIYFNFKRVKY